MVPGGVLPETPVVDVAVIVATTGLIWVGSGWLESSAEHLATYYGLPAVVQGSIVVAVGSSFPELASVVFTAVAGVMADGPLDANRTLVYKEAQFYMIAVSTLIVTFALAVRTDRTSSHLSASI